MQQNRSTAFEGGSNDERWREINDNNSIGGGNHSDQESSSAMDGPESNLKNLMRQLTE